jgi:hypothetical protein
MPAGVDGVYKSLLRACHVTACPAIASGRRRKLYTTCCVRLKPFYAACCVRPKAFYADLTPAEIKIVEGQA